MVDTARERQCIMTAAVMTANVRWRMDASEQNTSITVNKGVTALIGPSGAGKSTLARVLAGLHDSCGDITLNGEAINHLTPAERDIGLVMQEPTLFPTMTVIDNIMLANKLAQDELQKLMAMTDVQHIATKAVTKLSGGEARRVAVVRALAAKPKLLILDEPMNGLDPRRRKNMILLIRKISQLSETPIILITHQIEEMLGAADQAILINEGFILRQGPVSDVLAAPETGKYLGINDPGCLITAEVTGRQDDLLVANIGGQSLYLSDDGEPLGSHVRLRILARDIALSKQTLKDVSVLNQLQATISEINETEDTAIVTLQLNGCHLKSRITKKSLKDMQLSSGMSIHLLIKAVAVKELMLLGET
jgi:molybdate transport system ATP-binding protein